MTQAPKCVEFIGVIGRPGSGKDVQVSKLQETIENCTVLNLGDIIRASAEVEHRFHELIREVREISTDGTLTDKNIEQLLEILVEEAMRDGATTIVANALPRLPSQPTMLQGYFQKLRSKGITVNDHYLYFFVPHEEAERRLRERRAKEQRTDDTPEVIAHRREQFETLTWNAGIQVAASKKLIVIDGRKAPDDVHAQVMHELHKRRNQEL